jgi:ribosomal protein S18 acetylase RimI-like enzyme
MKLTIKKYEGKNEKEPVYHLVEPLNQMDYPLNFKRTNVLFISYVKGKAICFLGLNQRAGYWYYRGCYVLPEYRGNGFQKKLMKYSFKVLLDKGISRVSSLVHIENVHSFNNCKDLGFKIIGREKDNYRILTYSPV